MRGPIARPLSAALLKALVLTSGVAFTEAAVRHARETGAKTLQRVYNAPADAHVDAPQELLLTDPDGYACCASAVAPVPGRNPVVVDVSGGDIHVVLPDGLDSGDVSVAYVPKPAYYERTLASGPPLTRLVSACGVSEMNIWPWHDCAIGRLCRFCGINRVAATSGRGDLMSARGAHHLDDGWLDRQREAVTIAAADPTYDAELFPIIISGNLRDDELDLQAGIYASLAEAIAPIVADRAGPEGLVAITAPCSPASLTRQRDAGIRTMAINLEVYAAEAFRVHCPGKDRIGRDVYESALDNAVDVFGAGHVWTNLILGLEPIESALAGTKALAERGIVCGASVLHFDEGATTSGHLPPTFDEAVWFFQQLAELHAAYDQKPHFSARALRSSLANEAFDGRF